MTTVTDEMVAAALATKPHLPGPNAFTSADRTDMRRALTAALSKLPPAPDRSELPVSVLRFDTLLNDPPAFENETRVREYRHQMWPRWKEVVADVWKLVASPPDRNAVIEECATAAAGFYDNNVLNNHSPYVKVQDKIAAAIRALKTDGEKQ